MGTTASVDQKSCPNCGKSVAELLRLDADMKGRLAGDAGMSSVPDNVCADCFSKLNGQLNAAAAKRSKKLAKEQHRLNLWRSRVHLIREARERFAIKDFAGAVVNYEKYFRVLEIIYEVKPNEIRAAHFNNSARSKELVVIASAYWDLMRIYDQSKRFSRRLDQCAEKLGEFLPFTPIYSEILRKVEEYRKVAKNKAAFDKVILIAGKGRRRCFIATAAFESPDASEVVILSQFRDKVLSSTAAGRTFIGIYYKVSPPIARALDKNALARKTARAALSLLSTRIARTFDLN